MYDKRSTVHALIVSMIIGVGIIMYIATASYTKPDSRTVSVAECALVALGLNDRELQRKISYFALNMNEWLRGW